MEDRKERIAELVSLIQNGHDEYILPLWENVERLISRYANKYLVCLSANGTVPGGVEKEDLEQAGYFAILNALSNYDPSKGAFSTLLVYYLRREFQKAAGIDGNRKREPLNYSLSLDAPVNDDEPEGETRLDFISDPRDYYSGIDESIFQEQLHKALETALDTIPAKEADVLRAEYWQGKKQTEIAEEMGVTDERVRQLRNGGLRHIRNSSARAQLEKILDMETPFYKNVSVEHFTRTHTSAVEAVAIWREKRRREIGKSICSS